MDLSGGFQQDSLPHAKGDNGHQKSVQPSRTHWLIVICEFLAMLAIYIFSYGPKSKSVLIVPWQQVSNAVRFFYEPQQPC
jgi:hypothetical protein